MTPDQFGFEVVQLDRLFRVRDTARDVGTRDSAATLIDAKLAELAEQDALAWFAAFRMQDVCGWKMQDAMGTPAMQERLREFEGAMLHVARVVPEEVRKAVNLARRAAEIGERERLQVESAKAMN